MVTAARISVIVPTLWACAEFDKYVLDAADLAVIKEVIVIDNNPADRPPCFNHPKIRVITQKRNIFVNPAWNLGARLAKGDVLCFLNDDLHPVADIYPYALALLDGDYGRRFGLIGMNSREPNGPLGHAIVPWRTNPHFGAMIFMRSGDFRPVPGSMKIWWGDEFFVFLCFLRDKKILEVRGYLGMGKRDQEVSVSLNSNRDLFNRIVERDTFFWLKIHRRLLLLRYKPLRVLAHSLLKRCKSICRPL